MAEPKVGYRGGVYRVVTGLVLPSGQFTPGNVPKEGFAKGVYVLNIVKVNADGDLEAPGSPGTIKPSDDIGVRRYVSVSVDVNGNVTPSDPPQEGFVPGIYRGTTTTTFPAPEGYVPTFTCEQGTISSGIWTAIP